MPRLFYGNFDFEESLVRPAGQRRSKSVARTLAELATSWVAVVERDDLIWSPSPMEDAFSQRLVEAGWPAFRFVWRREDIPAGCELIPWGWTEEAIRFGEQVAAVVHAPPLDAVREVNSRQFAFELEHSLGVSLPGSAIASTLDELIGAVEFLESHGHNWVAKAEFSQAGRNQFRSAALQPALHSDSHGMHRLKARAAEAGIASWARRQLQRGGRLYVEPWLDAVSEVGLQFVVAPDGTVTLFGLAEMLPSTDGSYGGSIVNPTDGLGERWADAVNIASRAAAAVACRGYFGPLGIDAMRYRHPDGTLAFRPLQDLNARWTMGRLSLGLRRFVPSGAHARWLHGRRNFEAIQRDPVDPPSRQIIPTSLDVLDGQPVARRTALVFAPHDHTERLSSKPTGR